MNKNLIALYGIGELGKKLCLTFQEKGIKIDYLLDNKKKGEEFEGIIINFPDDISLIKRKSTIVIISTFKQELQINEIVLIKEKLLKLGYEKILNLQEAILFYDIDFEYFYVGNPKLFNDINIEKITTNLCDKESENCLNEHYAFRFDGGIERLNKNLSKETMYFPNFFISYLKSKQKSIRVVDCGACYGDLLDGIISSNLKLSGYIAIEPDKKNRQDLIDKIKKNNVEGCILPVGVGICETDLPFCSGGGMGSNFGQNGHEKVKIIRLEESVIGQIDFIKMDIEGFELEALKGAENIIKKYKPALAISIYHKPLDILTIQTWLTQFYKNFYIRQHSRYGFDLILYCF